MALIYDEIYIEYYLKLHVDLRILNTLTKKLLTS